MVVVPKPNRDLKMCINFWKFNMEIINKSYSMHRINNHLEAIAGSTVFKTLNLT